MNAMIASLPTRIPAASADANRQSPAHAIPAADAMALSWYLSLLRNALPRLNPAILLLIQAQIREKAAGMHPGHTKSLLEAMTADAMPWDSHLAEIISDTTIRLESLSVTPDSRLDVLRKIGDAFRLDPLSINILMFAWQSSIDGCTSFLFKDVLEFDALPVTCMLACALDVSVGDIRCACAPGSPLIDACTLKFNLLRPFHDRKLALADWLESALDDPRLDVDAPLTSFFRSGTHSPALTFPEIGADFGIALNLLKNAVATGARGINILLHGPAGCGKGSLARLLACEAGLEWREVLAPDYSGLAESSLGFVPGYTMAQKEGNAPAAVIVNTTDVFQEALIQDRGELLISGHFGMPFDQAKHHGKQWIMNTFQGNPRPTLWITDDVSSWGEWELTQFTWRIRMERLPARHCAPLFQAAMPRHEADNALALCVRTDSYAPVFLRNTAKTLSLMGDSGLATPALVQRAIRSLKGVTNDSSIKASSAHTPFNVEFSKVKGRYPLSRLVPALQRNPLQTLCLYGPPGTGKTEFAAHLATCLGKPLLVRRSSQFLDKYIGETEKNISKMFEEAANKNAVLFLDEADALLGRRDTNSEPHMRSHTNEVLQCMEMFQGLFMCATNQFEMLDSAAVRRFSLKLGFDYPDADQRWKLFCRETGMTPEDPANEPFRLRLNGMSILAPGDFATVRRQAILMEDSSPAFFLELLEEEYRIKMAHSGCKPIGFIM